MRGPIHLRICDLKLRNPDWPIDADSADLTIESFMSSMRMKLSIANP